MNIQSWESLTLQYNKHQDCRLPHSLAYKLFIISKHGCDNHSEATELYIKYQQNLHEFPCELLECTVLCDGQGMQQGGLSFASHLQCRIQLMGVY